MKKLRYYFTVGLLVISSQNAVAAENGLFGYTHLLPSPLTLPSGTLVFGTDLALGVTDFFQVGTNLLSNFYNVYNVNAKVSLVDYQEFALAVTGSYVRFNYQQIDSRNPDLGVSSILPGMVGAVEIAPALAWFIGGNLNYSSQSLTSDGVQTSGYMSGASLSSDLSFAYNTLGKKGRAKGVGNAASAGVSYDVNYKLFGIGVSHHWPGFHLGIHYYPGADLYPVRPILSGGGVWKF